MTAASTPREAIAESEIMAELFAWRRTSGPDYLREHVADRILSALSEAGIYVGRLEQVVRLRAPNDDRVYAALYRKLEPQEEEA